MIEFLCPEGHRIRCPKEKAGRPAKCPKCGVGFRIPTIEELGLGESTVADASLAGEEVTDVPACCLLRPAAVGKQPAGLAAPCKERQIEFLCARTGIIFMGRPACRAGRANVRSAARDFAFRSSTNRKRNRNPSRSPNARRAGKSLPKKRSRLENPTPGLSPSTSKRRNRWISYRSLDGGASPGRRNSRHVREHGGADSRFARGF